MRFTKEDLKIGDICQFNNDSLWQVNGDYLTQIPDKKTFSAEYKYYFLRNISLERFSETMCGLPNPFFFVSIDKVYRPKEFVNSLFSHSELQDPRKFCLIYNRYCSDVIYVPKSNIVGEVTEEGNILIDEKTFQTLRNQNKLDKIKILSKRVVVVEE